MTELRSDVSLREVEGTFRLEDRLTGFILNLGSLEAEVASNLGRDVEWLVEHLLARLDDGDDYAAEEVREEVEALLAQLSAAGVLEEGLSADEIRSRQRDQHRDQVLETYFQRAHQAIEHAARRVPMHRDRIDLDGLRWAQVQSPLELRRVPLSGREELRANFPNRVLVDGAELGQVLRAGTIEIGSTSGSTDERMQAIVDHRLGGLPRNAGDLWQLPEGTVLERGALFTGPRCTGTECHLGKATMEERTRGVTLALNSADDLMVITEEEIRAIVGELHQWKPDVLFVNPWYAVWLGKRARDLGLEIPPIRVILSTYQYLTRRHRRLIAERLGARAYSMYGATELGGAAVSYECHVGRHHVGLANTYVEVCDGEGAPHLGALGWITLTTLRNRYMPLVRYQPGDLGILEEEPCPCGHGPLTLVLHGRERDRLQRPNGSFVTVHDIDEAIGEEGPDFYCLVQLGDDAYRWEVMLGEGSADPTELRRLLGPGAQLEVREVERFFPERSLKFRQTRREDR